MKLLITGGSHVAALNAGLKKLVADRRWPGEVSVDVKPLGSGLTGAGRFFDVRGDRVAITHERFRLRLPGLSPAQDAYDAVGFCTPFHSRGVWIEADWARFGPPWCDDGRTPVSQGLLQRCIADHHASLIAFMVALRDVGYRVFAIEGPRPFRHSPEIAVAGEDTVSWIDDEYRRLTSETLARAGIGAVRAPAATHDDQGYTLDEYRHADPSDHHHANAGFGERMMAAVRDHIQCE